MQHCVATMASKRCNRGVRMHCMLRTIGLFLVLLQASAQATPVPEIPALRRYTAADGLPATFVSSLAQDLSGHLWLGTADGLARYDGIAFKVYRYVPDDPLSLPGNVVQALYIDARDRVFVGVEGGGLSMLDPAREHFVHWQRKTHSELQSDDVFTITGTRDGAIWFGTYAGGLYRLDSDGTLRGFWHDPKQADSLPSDTVIALAVDATGTLWVGTIDGLARWNGSSFDRIDNANLTQPLVVSLSADAKGGLWIGTRGGLVYRSPDGQIAPAAWRDRLADPNVLRVLADTRGEHWVATNKGIYRVDDTAHLAPLVLQHMLGKSDTAVHDMLIDHEGGIWFASRMGLLHLPPGWRRFASPNPGPEDGSTSTGEMTRSLSSSHDGMIWANASQLGLRRLDPGTGQLLPPPAWTGSFGKALLYAISERQDGSLWISQRDKLLSIDPRTGARRLWHVGDAADAPLTGNSDQFIEMRDGTLWSMNLGIGMQARDPAGRVIDTIIVGDGKGLEAGDVEQIGIGADGALWVAGGDGLLAWNAGEHRLQPITGMPQERVYGFALAGDGAVWLALLGALERYRWDGEQLERMLRIDQRQGFPAVAPGGVLIGRAGEVWATTPRGLVRYSPESDMLRLYGLRAGLPSQAFYDRPPLLSADGLGIASTQGGLLLFDPEPDQRLDRAEKPSSLVIENITVRRANDDTKLPNNAPVMLGPLDRDLRIVARLLSYADVSAHRYRYRMVGYDDDWVTVASHGERVFAHLPAGRYQLHVQAADAWGNWTHVTPLDVQVRPPWWASTLARLAYVIAALLVIALFAIAYRTRLRRRHAFEMAEQRRELAEHSSLAKTRFLATMGHEVRTPMSGVMGMTELLLGTPLSAPQRRYAESIRQAGQHLLRLVDDALDLARIEADKLTLIIAPFAARTVLEQVRQLLQPLAERKGLDFAFSVADGVPEWLAGDADRIRQIVLNLTTNAIKFTDHGSVTLHVNWANDELHIMVSDTGPGLNAEQCQRIFARFEQAEGARTASRYGGSGLGLAICQELAAAMGGTIRVRSHPGQGSRFTVCLPLAIASAPAAQAAQQTSPSRAVSRHVLLVEDDITVAEVVGSLLRNQGHSVVHAGHALSAISELEAQSFDLAFIDLDLPGLDGLALARLIRSRGYRLPLIAITARADAEAEPAARDAGMNDFLRKPLAGQHLLDAMARHTD
ncbi:MAG: histidine kinase [Gammaproteobacteria bacterium HGW-Gammaproteobacteria-2]|nr:MAG: histidine kinase [Gammaproteobacteria bacterium HGW-Gammaproteobacteria-2]